MYRRTISLEAPFAAGTVTFDEARNSVLAATTDGRLVAVRLFDAAVVEIGAGYTSPVGVLRLADGVRVAIAEADGAVLLAGRHRADRQHAWELAGFPGPILGLAEHPDSDALLVLSYDPETDGSRVSRCDLDTGDVTALATVDAGRRMVVDPDGRRVIVLAVLADDSRQLVTIGLDDGSEITVDTDAYDHVAAAPAGALFATRPDPSTPDTDVLALWDGTETSYEPLPGRVDGLTRWGSLVLVASGAELHAVEWGMDEGPLPIAAPLGPLTKSGYTRLQVDLPALGLAVGDVVYEVLEGPDYGSISLGIEPPNADGTESVMVLAGLMPGEFHVSAVRVSDWTVLASRRIRVTTLWPDPVNGPPIAVTGEVGTTLMDWGGVGGVAGYRFPAPPEVWHVLVVLLHLRDRKFDNENAVRNEWKDRAVGGGESLKRFYEEVSAYEEGRHGMTIKLVEDRVFGPVLVDRGWGDVFETRGGVDDGWLSTDAGVESMADTVSGFFADMPGGDVLINRANSIVFVIRSGSDGPVSMGPGNPDMPTEYVWGSALPDVDFWRKTWSPSYPTIPTTFTPFQRPVMFMSDVVPSAAPLPDLTRTLCHELGHNLGLDDLYDRDGDYPAEINARDVDALDLMSSTNRLPHFSLANRIALGWIDPSWLQRFDFTFSPTGDDVTLQAIQTVGADGPTNGRKAGIEVPIDDAWSYLFEYRREQPDQIGDRRLNPVVVAEGDELIAGTDLRVRGGEVARPPILELPKDVDGDGPVLNYDRENYRESDTTNTQRMHDFVLTLDQIRTPDDDSAMVKVEYVRAHRPQLMVHPAPGNGDFKSPDIRLIGPGGQNVPVVKGTPNNTIEIKVHNVGSKDATEVKIHVKWMPFGLTPGTWRNLDDPAEFDVAAHNNFTIVTVPWELDASVPVGPDNVEATHFCVRVDIEHYKDAADPDGHEIVVWDNWAQSNFYTAGVGRGSPSDRLATAVTATNSLDRTATYRFAVRQDTPWYRVYLGNAWLRLTSGETRAVALAYESLAGDPLYGSEFEENLEEIYTAEHHVSIASSVVPARSECDAPRRVFGCGLSLRAGDKVFIDDVHYNVEGIFATVRVKHDGDLQALTAGEFHIAAWPEDDPQNVAPSSGSVVNGDAFAPMPDSTWQQLDAGVPVVFVASVPAGWGHIEAVTGPSLLNP